MSPGFPDMQKQVVSGKREVTNKWIHTLVARHGLVPLAAGALAFT